MRLLIVNGPNLHNIGDREPEFYGNFSFSKFLELLRKEFSEIEIDYYQSHIEGELVKRISSAKNEHINGIVFNGGAYSHNSVALADSIKNSELPVVGVHISNVYAREPFRKKNIYAKNCLGVITGFGLNSYKLAILSLKYYLNGEKQNNT